MKSKHFTECSLPWKYSTVNFESEELVFGTGILKAFGVCVPDSCFIDGVGDIFESI